MDLMELNFEKNLWGQYDKLHSRLIKKISYYNNVHKIFVSIRDSSQNIMKKLNEIQIFVDPIIFPHSSSNESNDTNSAKKEIEYHGFPLIIKIIKDYLKEIFDFNNQTLENILNNIKTLLQLMNNEENEYKEYLTSYNSYLNSKTKMEENMKIYFQKAKLAEQSVYDLKKLELKYSQVNKDEIILENIKKLRENSIELVKDSFNYFKIYKDSLIKANQRRENIILLEKLLLFKYQDIEEQTGKINTTISFLFSYNLNIQKEINVKKIKEMENAKKTLNVNKDIRQLIIEYSGNNEPFAPHILNNYESQININKCENNDDYQVVVQTIQFIKSINNEAYPDFNKELEDQKNGIREALHKLFVKYTNENAEMLKEYIKNPDTHNYFIILLSKLRSNNTFNIDINLYNLFGDIFNTILNNLEKTKDYSNATNIMILSQTYYKKENNEKKYLVDTISNKWITSFEFWIKFIDMSLNNEILKIANCNEITKKEILDNSDTIDGKMKFKLSEVIFSQLLPYITNMNELKMDKSIILHIIDKFCEQYKKIINKVHADGIYGLISQNKEEINKLREKYKKNSK